MTEVRPKLVSSMWSKHIQAKRDITREVQLPGALLIDPQLPVLGLALDLDERRVRSDRQQALISGPPWVSNVEARLSGATLALGLLELVER